MRWLGEQGVGALPWEGCGWVSGYMEGRKEGPRTEQRQAVVTVPGDSTFGSGLVPALGAFLCPSLQPPPAVSSAVTSAPPPVPHGRPLVGLSIACGLQPASFCLLILWGPGVCVCGTSLLPVLGPSPFAWDVGQLVWLCGAACSARVVCYKKSYFGRGLFPN